MAYRLVLFSLILFSVRSYASYLQCNSNSSKLYIVKKDKSYAVDDLYFAQDFANPAWINCNLFIKKIYENDDLNIKYKVLMGDEVVRVRSDNILKSCVDFKYCFLRLSTILSRPDLWYRSFLKRGESYKRSFSQEDKELSIANNLLDLTDSTIALRDLGSSYSPVDYYIENASEVSHVSTMTFDSDAVEAIIKAYRPGRKLHLYFAGQLQYMSDDVDLSIFKDYPDIILHPMFLNATYRSSFHIKGIMTSAKTAFFTINLKKAKTLLNDLLFISKADRARDTFQKVLRTADKLNCSIFNKGHFFSQSFKKYDFIRSRYLEFCNTLDIAEEDFTTSLFEFESLKPDKSYTIFSHIIHPESVKLLPESNFYVARVSKKEELNLKNLNYNRKNHYKFILGEKCVYYMSSNLTPTALSNRGEFSFKSCNKQFYDELLKKSEKLKLEYKDQDV